MSTPFPLEDAQQQDNLRETWNPWNQAAPASGWAGIGFDDEHPFGVIGTAVNAMGAGAAKGEAVLGSLVRYASPGDSLVSDQSDFADRPSPGADLIEADAKQRVAALTPNAATTGAAAQLLHGLVSGGTEMAIGGLSAGLPGAAALVGGAEGIERYNELIDAGVDPATAQKSGFLAGGSAAVGAVLPIGVGSGLLTKVVTGAVSQSAFGIANRYADNHILESAGYPEMAAQQRVIDGTQVITDLILGAAFGGLAHLHSPELDALRDAPGAREAALTTNLALKDRDAAPGVPADPAAANAHQAALEASIADLMQGKAVDVSDSGVTEAKFVEKPIADDPDIQDVLDEHLEERRTDDARRKAVADMTPDELRREVLNNQKSGLPGKRSLEEQPELPAKIHLDLDGLKAVNDAGGHDAGDQLILTAGQILHDELGLNMSHDSGDEFSGQGQTVAELHETMGRVNDRLAQAKLDFEAPDGGKLTLNGIGLSYGVGESHVEAERNLIAHKAERERQGLRASRGELPPGASRTAPGERVQADLGNRAAQGSGARDGVEPPDPTAQILRDRPQLTIRDENGKDVNAAEALQAANDEVATTRRESQIAAQAAISCYMRRGG